MTEAQWLASINTDAMLVYLREKGSARKFRLFACACGRHLWEQLTSKRCRKAIEAAEQYADGLIPRTQMIAAGASASAACSAWYWPPHVSAARDAALADAWVAAAGTGRWARRAGVSRPCQCAVIRDIFGNPFRPCPVLDPGWLKWNGATVVQLAQVIYEERGFDQLPILADALEEAGCTDGDILSHCRGPGPHVRGCWVVDLLLGKK